MVQRGLVRPHWTGVGIDVTRKGRVIDVNGKKSAVISAVGTMRGGDTMVRERSYGQEKQGSGGRIGPVAFSIPGIRQQFDDTANSVLEHANENHIKATEEPVQERLSPVPA